MLHSERSRSPVESHATLYPLAAHTVGHAGDDAPMNPSVADPACAGAPLEAKDMVTGAMDWSSLYPTVHPGVVMEMVPWAAL